MSEERQKQPSGEVIREFEEYLSTVSVGEGIHYRNLTVFPLFAENGKEPPYIASWSRP